jgi:hypothetical protein
MQENREGSGARIGADEELYADGGLKIEAQAALGYESPAAASGAAIGHP